MIDISSTASKNDQDEIDNIETFCTGKRTKFTIEGRRILDISYIVSQMISGCSFCKKALQLIDITNEYREGLASLLYILCECGATNTIYTSSYHFLNTNSDSSTRVFDVNTCCAGGKYLKLLNYRSG